MERDKGFWVAIRRCYLHLTFARQPAAPRARGLPRAWLVRAGWVRRDAAFGAWQMAARKAEGLESKEQPAMIVLPPYGLARHKAGIWEVCEGRMNQGEARRSAWSVNL